MVSKVSLSCRIWFFETLTPAEAGTGKKYFSKLQRQHAPVLPVKSRKQLKGRQLKMYRTCSATPGFFLKAGEVYFLNIGKVF